MASPDRLTRLITFRPLSVIETILAVVLVIFGIYLDSPFYESFPTTSIGAVFEADLARLLISLVYLVPPALLLIGHRKSSDKFRSVGLFGIFLAYFFITILRLATFGWQPLSWLFTLALAIIAAIVFINFKLKLPSD